MPPVPPSCSSHPDVWKFNMPIYHAESRTQLRAWLQHHHSTARGVWLCSWRSNTQKPRCPYPHVVEELLCFGWIDSTATTLDEQRGLQLLTPRKPKSSWSRLNRQRFAEMEAAGLVVDAGRDAARVAQSNGYWTISDSVEDLVEPEALAEALDENVCARTAWDAIPPGARKQMLWWVASAVRPNTRAKRIATIVEKAALGERAQ